MCSANPAPISCKPSRGGETAPSAAAAGEYARRHYPDHRERIPTETIRASVADVQYTLLPSVVLVVGVIFVFLLVRYAPPSFPAIALPLSLIGTFGVMDLLGFGLDNLSLMALTVATGFVVDDAIVMIENVVRHIERGMRPLDAAQRTARRKSASPSSR